MDGGRNTYLRLARPPRGNEWPEESIAHRSKAKEGCIAKLQQARVCWWVCEFRWWRQFRVYLLRNTRVPHLNRSATHRSGA